MQRRDFLAAGAALATVSLSARAAAWPEQPIRWIVPYPAGGGTDAIVGADDEDPAESRKIDGRGERLPG